MSVLVLITGTGRSGTSTMSGTFHHLGLHVPGPYLGANASNPKGFYESKWAVGFHKELLRAAGLHDFDSRPDALERTSALVTDEQRARLRDFLAEQAGQADQVVVKDPRSVFAQALWRDAAAAAGLDIRYVTMLRHPAEVIGSRATYYAGGHEESERRSYETFNVARWVNSCLISERETRGQARAFVGYPALLADWRPVLAGLADDLGLRYDVDLATGEPCAVDDFIDPGLRRHQVTWDELDIPAPLQEIAQTIWDALEALGAGHGVDPAASAVLDEQAARWARLFAQSADIAHDAVEEARHDAREEGRREGAERVRTRQARRRAQEAGAAAPRGPLPLGRRPVDEVGARDLLRVVGSRVKRRLGR